MPSFASITSRLALPSFRARIVNVVLTADLRQKIDLPSLSKLEWVRSNFAKYPAAYMKTPDMVGRVTIFSSGKIISVGTTSVSRAKLELREVTGHLVGSGVIKPVRLTTRVQNIVATFDLGCEFELERFVREANDLIYEPEQFPGVIHWHRDPKLTSLLFGSGKGVVAGARTINELHAGLEEIGLLVRRYELRGRSR